MKKERGKGKEGRKEGKGREEGREGGRKGKRRKREEGRKKGKDSSVVSVDQRNYIALFRPISFSHR